MDIGLKNGKTACDFWQISLKIVLKIHNLSGIGIRNPSPLWYHPSREFFPMFEKSTCRNSCLFQPKHWFSAVSEK